MIARSLAVVFAAAIIVGATARASMGEDASRSPPFQPYVDMKTFMEHVLTPAANIVWSVNGLVIDEKGEHDLSPKSDADWERILSGAATLAEATNALMIPQRARDPEWDVYAKKLAEAANRAYRRRRSSRPENDLRGQRSARRNLRRLSPPLRP